MSAPRRILLTGAAGFIGSHLADRLLADGHEVTGLDNFLTGSRRNIRHLLDEELFDFARHDVRSPFWGEFDTVLNFACPASPPFYQANAIGTLKINFQGTLNMLGLAKRCHARFLQASTSEVYGDPEEHPQRESYRGAVNPIGPRACYDEGKRVSEALTFEYVRQHGLDAKVVRIFNTYGPRMLPGDGRVVSNFIVQALKGDDITIFGDGTQTRSFCYISDLVEGLSAMLASPADFHGPVNLGNPSEFTVRQLAELVIDMVGSRSRLVARPLPEDDPRQRRPDISLARERLNWVPNVSLEEGLARTIAYFEAELTRTGDLATGAVGALAR